MYECKHGKKKESKSKGKRPVQHTIKLDCNAKMRWYKRVSGEIILKDFICEHNHPCTEEFFDQDTAKIDTMGIKILETMISGRCRIKSMKIALAEAGIKLNSAQIRYQVKKLLGAPMDSENLQRLIDNVKAEGGHTAPFKYPDNKVRALTVTTRKMASAFLGSKPTVLQIDTTFGFDRSKHKLCAILYRNPSTGRGEIAMFGFLADETLESYEFVFQQFSDHLSNSPPIIIIDKVVFQQ